jgi:hypothetical protein
MERPVPAMNLKDLLTEKKTVIVKKWFDAVVETYPGDTSGFLKKHAAQFTNPVGYTFAQGLEGLFDALIAGLIPDKVSSFLDGIVRIRAVQDFAPSQAVSFIFVLKRVVRGALENELRENRLSEELSAFDSTVDDLALFAFDIYMKCREKIYDLKAQEVKNATFRLLQQAKLMGKNE